MRKISCSFFKLERRQASSLLCSRIFNTLRASALAFLPLPQNPSQANQVSDASFKLGVRQASRLLCSRIFNTLRALVLVLCPLFFVLCLTACTDRKEPPAPVSVNGAALQNSNLPSIIVKRGDTVGNVAQRYRITPGEIITLNRLKPPHHIRIGQKLMLPQRVMGGGSMSPGNAAEGKAHTFISAPPKPGQVTAVPLDNPIPLSSKTVIEERPPAVAEPMPLLKTSSEKTSITAEMKENPRKPMLVLEDNTADIPTVKTIEEEAPKSVPEKIEPVMAQLEEAVSQRKKAKGSDCFAWPLKGKILKNFGKSDTGFQNDGINIQASEGDPIQCAEDGVVAYVGNELQGFGNLVMVKHRNGWMSAYAHCSETLVKRGDKIKRGKIIAKVGHSGSVRSPQLHFELRKKTKAVDPLAYLE